MRLFFFNCCDAPPDLHSFPTRRSSDLINALLLDRSGTLWVGTEAGLERWQPEHHGFARSEEHTSELQSLAYLVCRLLLEKKKYHRHLCPYDRQSPRRERLIAQQHAHTP